MTLGWYLLFMCGVGVMCMSVVRFSRGGDCPSIRVYSTAAAAPTLLAAVAADDALPSARIPHAHGPACPHGDAYRWELGANDTFQEHRWGSAEAPVVLTVFSARIDDDDDDMIIRLVTFCRQGVAGGPIWRYQHAYLTTDVIGSVYNRLWCATRSSPAAPFSAAVRARLDVVYSADLISRVIVICPVVDVSDFVEVRLSLASAKDPHWRRYDSMSVHRDAASATTGQPVVIDRRRDWPSAADDTSPLAAVWTWTLNVHRRHTCRHRLVVCTAPLFEPISLALLVEWLAHWRLSGVDFVRVYVRERPLLAPCLAPWVEAGFVEVIEFPAYQAYPRGFAYVDQDIVGDHCLGAFRHAADWVLSADADEYFVVTGDAANSSRGDGDGEAPLARLLGRMPPSVGAVLMPNWYHHARCNATWDDGDTAAPSSSSAAARSLTGARLMVEEFVLRDGEPTAGFKTKWAVRAAAAQAYAIHAPLVDAWRHSTVRLDPAVAHMRHLRRRSTCLDADGAFAREHGLVSDTGLAQEAPALRRVIHRVYAGGADARADARCASQLVAQAAELANRTVPDKRTTPCTRRDVREGWCY